MAEVCPALSRIRSNLCRSVSHGCYPTHMLASIAAVAAFAWSSVGVRADDAVPAISRPVVRAVTRGPAASVPQDTVAVPHSKKEPQRLEGATGRSPSRVKSKTPTTAEKASSGTPTAVAAANSTPPSSESSRVTRPAGEQPAPEPRCERLPPGPAAAPSFVAIRGQVSGDAEPVIDQPESEQVAPPNLEDPRPLRPATTVNRRQAAPAGRAHPRPSVPSRRM